MNRAQRRAQLKKGNSKTKVGLSVLAATSLVSGNISLLTTGAAAATCNVSTHAQLYSAAADFDCTTINVTSNITFDNANSGNFIVNHDVIIQGDFTIDATGNYDRIFTIEDGFALDGIYYTGDLNNNGRIDVTFDGLTLTNGNAQNNGGAIYAPYTYAPTRDLPIDITLRDVNLTSNYAQLGGAVLLDRGNLSIQGSSSFTNNESNDDGGGIFVHTGSITITTGTVATFTNNAAGQNNYGFQNDENGGAIHMLNGALNINGVATFTGNTANWDGGAVYIENGDLNISGTAGFTGNETLDDDGGAVYLFNGDLNISGAATFTSNIADGDGGAVYLDNGDFYLTGTASFTSNVSAQDGGGLYVEDGRVRISQTGTATFTSNVATEGGGVYTEGEEFFNEGTVTFISNVARTRGGAIDLDGGNAFLEGTSTFINNTAENGGALDVGTVFIGGNATFQNNTADFNGGAIEANGVFGEGEANVLFTGNRALDGNGGALNISYLVNSFFPGSKFSFINNSASGRGGAVFAQAAAFDSDYFAGNTAGSDGGAIFTYGNMGIVNSTFFENTAGLEGGALFSTTNGSEVALSTFVNNVAAVDGEDTPGQSIYTSGTLKLFGNIFASSNSGLAHLGEGGLANPEFTDLGGNLSTSEADAAELVNETSKIVEYAQLTLAAAPAIDGNYPNSTPTIQISTDSLAADAIDLTELAESLAQLNLAEGGLPNVDQRGAQRTLRYDAGAYEAGDSTYQAGGTVIEIAPKVVLPAAPNRVMVKRATRSALQVEWTQPTTAGTGKIMRYEIYRNGKKIATVPATKRSYRDAGLDSTQSYTYRIVTIGSQGKSIKSVNSQSVFPRR